MNNTIKMIGFSIVALMIFYGGYKILHHFAKKPKAYTAIAPTVPVSPTITANSIYKIMSNSKTRNYLTDKNDITLYIYSKDAVGKSNCAGKCLIDWPVYGPATQSAGLPTNVTVINRADGNMQYTWKGMPLYHFINDKTAGQITGNGVDGFILAQ